MPCLKPLVRKPRPSAPFAVWDIEAKPAYKGEPINTKWLGGGLYDGAGDARVFRSQDKYFEHLLSSRFAGYWMYAHNGSGYDLRYLVAWLCRRRIPWEAFTAGSRWFLRTEDREFIDSMAVLPMSLREAARKLGAEHNKHDVPDDFYETIEQQDWQTYLKGDLLSLFDCITIMREAVEALGGTLKRTLASTAVDLWRRVYLDDEYDVPEHDHPSEAAAREAYAGGKCQVYLERIDRGEYWDRNSSYPTAMLHPVPVEALDAREGSGIPSHGLVFARYTIPHEDNVPPLFYRKSIGDRMFHPTGSWEGWRTVDEARYLRSLYGSKSVKVERSIPFKAADLFSGYCKDLYAKRLTPGPVGVMAKRLLTNLYGRTGMTRERETIMSGPDLGFIDLDTKTQKKGPCRGVISRELGVYSETSPDTMKHEPTIMPAVAATITARGRIALNEVERQAPELAYCDTDSVVTGGKLDMQPSLDLGGWKIEAQLSSGVFKAPKAYRVIVRVAVGDKVPDARDPENAKRATDGPAESITQHAKGLSSRDVKLIDAYLAGEDIKVRHLPGIRESMRHGKPVDGPSHWQPRKHSAGGNRHPDGRPYRVEEADAL